MTGNGVINEIQSLLEDDKAISTQAAQRLILAAVKATYDKVDEVKEAAENNKKKIDTMWPAYKFIVWIAGVLGISMVGLIWSIIIGAAQVTFTAK